MIRNQRGFAHLLLILIMAVVIIGGALFWRFNQAKRGNSKGVSITEAAETAKKSSDGRGLLWQGTENGSWKSTSEAPSCPEPLEFTSSADISKVTSVLYPGQYRGGEYKAHGGFRFDRLANNKVAVKLPMDAYLLRGNRYLVNGEIQYVFDFINNCGIMHRFGHLLKLSPRLENIANQLPQPTEGDSRDTQVSPSPFFTAGEEIATAVGITKGGVNTFFDWGVYDLRQTNQAWKNAAYRNKHADGMGITNHAICWFDMLPKADAARVKALPGADQTSGKKSDYCR